MIGKSFVIFCLVFNAIQGQPLKKDEEPTAFDVIDKTNRELPEPLQQALDEGDMFIPENAALKKSVGQWPNAYVPYTLSNSFNDGENQKIRSALQDIMRAAPCMKFKEFVPGSAPSSHVSVIKSGGCWSMVGRTGGKQSLSLGQGCVYTGTIIHEFLHAIGFYHEQSRPDRDDHIIVNWKNIVGGREHNFNKAKNIDSLGVKYDEKSVMHYSSGAFSNGNGPTLESKKGGSLGGRALTKLDILQINLKYCGGKPTTTTTTMRPKTTTTTKTPKTTKKTTTTTTTTTMRPKTTTTTTTKMTTKKPTTGVCSDKSGYCIVALNRRSCDGYLKTLCPRTCRQCTGPKVEECLNLKDQSSNCRQRAQNGDCQVENNYSRWTMKNLCPRSCCERNELYR